MADQWTEEHLEILRQFICGERNFWHMGKGIHVYPDQVRDRLLWAGCLELERQGFIRRKIDGPNHVYFVPVGE